MNILCKLKQVKITNYGFMLADVVIGIFVVTIGLVALSYLYDYGTSIAIIAEREEKAVQIAGAKIEILKAADGKSFKDLEELIKYINANNIVIIDDINFKVEAQGKDYLDTEYLGDENIYPVSINVSWSDPTAQKLTLRTYVYAPKTN